MTELFLLLACVAVLIALRRPETRIEDLTPWQRVIVLSVKRS